MRLLGNKELQVINDVLAKYSHMTAKQISNISHEDAPWNNTDKIGSEINYELVYQRVKGHNF